MAQRKQKIPKEKEESLGLDEEGLIKEEPEWYDPDVDDKDEAWVEKQRRGHESDAILSCPACLTTLCLDCQRHEKYTTQYRAMFVQSCRISEDQILRQQPRQKKRKQLSDAAARENQPASQRGGEVFRPVFCEHCGTEVAVMDEDEVYHFFNAVASCA
eukprot:TRINITY_DN4316_c0_g1_i7.p1 TRINITY_DN4316_c0_g1~~TRINITY_DN4316_c0_g1_i7.p1  ORF type:complete len:184 (-),score=27.37 TRINITY_DN4316_c0_g1_i7:98-571(-)